ncbi:hypothetical protein ANN_16392 [Periplaneta americana]|uniref:Uncharacterized protein n=1 Tax=Periplaneta americana TaxID=6978 RepID=A0ABQ8SJ56_PERAM|nr:hypothetical protein ANN_16392 [Periplaneta americana]
MDSSAIIQNNTTTTTNNNNNDDDDDDDDDDDNNKNNTLKDVLGGTRFGSDEELKKTVNTWLNELAAEEYNTGILKLVNRYDKCLNVGGDYVEK